MGRPRRVPVVVLAGFLGSGKTTLLNHLLRRSGGTRIGAVVNDFGSIGIDAMAVAGQADSTVPLGDGCLCCAVDTSDMDEVLDRLARPSVGMDVIVVEASGLAEPETVIRMVLASASEHIVYGGLVEVVDGAEFDGALTRHPELERHVRAADLVVLGKADLVDEGELRLLRERLERMAPGRPVVPAAHGRVDPALLFDPVHRPRPPVEQLSFDELWRESADEEAAPEAEDGACAGGDHSGHIHAAYESVEFTADEPLDPRRFMSFLDGRPPGLYRIKGFVDFGAADPLNSYTVHAVGRFLRFTPEPRPAGEAVRTQLVLIGAGVDGEALRKELAACTAADDGEPRDPSAMWGVLRYVDSGGDEPQGADEPYGPGEPGGAADELAEFADPPEFAGPAESAGEGGGPVAGTEPEPGDGPGVGAYPVDPIDEYAVDGYAVDEYAVDEYADGYGREIPEEGTAPPAREAE